MLVTAALALIVITLLGFTVLSILVALLLLGFAAWSAWSPRPTEGLDEPTAGSVQDPAAADAAPPTDGG